VNLKPASTGTAGRTNFARYFFNVSDGEARSFPQCIDLPSVQDARREATKMACAAISENSDTFWRTREWQLTVTDERGLNLFSLLILAADAPAGHGR
jgi:hypothetical protein